MKPRRADSSDHPGNAPGGALRIDKLLWFLRLTPTRSAAQALVEAGHIRLDGRRVTKPGSAVRAGAVLVLPTYHGSARSLRIDRLPARRGGAPEAAAHFVDLGADGATATTPGPAQHPGRISATDSQHGAHA